MTQPFDEPLPGMSEITVPESAYGQITEVPIDETAFSSPEGQISAYERPAVSVAVTFRPGSTGSPQELVIDFKDPPSQAQLDQVFDQVTRWAGPAVLVTREQADPLAKQKALGYCSAQGEGHDAEDHYCLLADGHPPVEEGGRAHRCRCGGIFAAHGEVPDVAASPRRDKP